MRFVNWTSPERPWVLMVGGAFAEPKVITTDPRENAAGVALALVQAQEDASDAFCLPMAQACALADGQALIAVPFDLAEHLILAAVERYDLRGELANTQALVNGALKTGLPVEHAGTGCDEEFAQVSLNTETAEVHEGGVSAAFLAFTDASRWVVVDKAKWDEVSNLYSE